MKKIWNRLQVLFAAAAIGALIGGATASAADVSAKDILKGIAGIVESVAGDDDTSAAGQVSDVQEQDASEETIQATQQSGIQNILLIGSDHRDDSWNGNSDVMIVATLNHDARRIVLTSFMRDLYADIPGHGVHKLNYAFAVGGAETLKNTLADNYGLNIDHYAIVDFDSMAAIIDILGGVELTVSDDEAGMINGYLYSMNASQYNISGGGTYVLNGYQAVAHMRDRYVGNYDYQRTQRQRDVLTQIFKKAETLTAGEMAKLSKQLVTEMTHDFSAMDILDLVGSLSSIANYELVDNRIPYDGMYSSQGEMLVPDFEATRARLHETLGDQ